MSATVSDIADDLQLVADCRKGDTRGFEQLVLCYQRSLYNTALRISGNETAAAEIVQESFLSAWRKMSDFRRLYLKHVFVMLLMLIQMGCSKGPQLPPLSADGVILAFGDSLTAGNGATAEDSYPSVLSRLTGRRVINAGVPGEVTAAGLARLPETLNREKPALVLLCLGGNDFLQQLDPVKAEENLHSMVEMMRKRGISVVVIGVPRLGLGLDVPDWYGRLAKESNIPYEGKIMVKILADRRLKSDLIHPNAAGYRQIAEALFMLLKKSGALQ